MVAAGLSALTIHSLLYYCPFSVIGHDEAVQVKVEIHLELLHYLFWRPVGSSLARPAPSIPTRSPIKTNS